MHADPLPRAAPTDRGHHHSTAAAVWDSDRGRSVLRGRPRDIRPAPPARLHAAGGQQVQHGRAILPGGGCAETHRDRLHCRVGLISFTLVWTTPFCGPPPIPPPTPQPHHRHTTAATPLQELLQVCGRTHTLADVYAAIEAMHASGERPPLCLQPWAEVRPVKCSRHAAFPITHSHMHTYTTYSHTHTQSHTPLPAAMGLSNAHCTPQSPSPLHPCARAHTQGPNCSHSHHTHMHTFPHGLQLCPFTCTPHPTAGASHTPTHTSPGPHSQQV